MAARYPAVPGYEIDDEIGRTLQAVVFKARDTRRNMPVALKLVQNDDKAFHEVEMLQQVARANPGGPAHVMRLLDTHQDGLDLWLAVEYYSATLDQLDARAMTPFAVMNVALDTVRGMLEMWRVNIVDDDIKPANVAFKSASGRVAHVDLGCARLRGEPSRGCTEVFGAPELKHGVASDTSPCYGWGRTMEFLVTGRAGFGPDYLLSDCVPWVGRRFARLVAACGHHNPNRRPTVEALVQYVSENVELRKRCPRCNAMCFRDGACPTC